MRTTNNNELAALMAEFDAQQTIKNNARRTRVAKFETSQRRIQRVRETTYRAKRLAAMGIIGGIVLAVLIAL